MNSTSKLPKIYVLDACALLAVLNVEQGVQLVKSLITDDDNLCTIHAVNLCEVYYDQIRAVGAEQAQEFLIELVDSGIGIRQDLDKDFWMAVAELKVNPGKLSLADCFAIALTQRLGATLVTSDHHEFDRIDQLGTCPILFIR